MWKTSIDSPVGMLQAFAHNQELCGLLWPEANMSRFDKDKFSESPEQPIFQQLTEQLGEYFAGDRQKFDLALAPVGTEFQRLVWAALSEIPFGETRSYGEQAHTIGRPKAVRAVGAANGMNPISIVIPCHRVIGANGNLTGFAGGIDVKQFLLKHESSIYALNSPTGSTTVENRLLF